MTDAERRSAADKFVADWKNRGDEKQETQRFGLHFSKTSMVLNSPRKPSNLKNE